MKKFLLASLLILFPTVGFSQGVTATAQWFQPNILSDAQAYTYTLKVDTAAPVTLTATCVTVNTQVQCSAPITGWVPSISHTLVLSVSSTSGATASSTFQTQVAPGVPTGGKVIVIIIGDDNGE